jgi:hypothetical protein
MSKNNVKTLQQEVVEGFDKLGAKLHFEADADLAKMKRGAPMRRSELEAMGDSGMCWLVYREHEESSPCVNGAYRFSRGGDGYDLRDGSSLGAWFDLGGQFVPRGQEILDWETGSGRYAVFHVAKL